MCACGVQMSAMSMASLLSLHLYVSRQSACTGSIKALLMRCPLKNLYIVLRSQLLAAGALVAILSEGHRLGSATVPSGLPFSVCFV